jgi:hypothetical protein
MAQADSDRLLPYDVQATIVRPTMTYMFDHPFERRVQGVCLLKR